jgi:hypothetical protein
MKKMLIIVLSCMVLSGCATGYGRCGLTGGFTDMKIQDNIYKVVFEGNGYCSGERASDFALLRCAELTLENGYYYFVPLEQKSDTKTTGVTTPVTSQTTGRINTFGNSNYQYGSFNATTQSYGGQTMYFNKPETSLMIACFKEKPENVSAMIYDAEQISTNIKKTYNIKDNPKPSKDLTKAN